LISARLFVRNLPYTVTEQELEEYFGRFGDIADVHIPLDSVKKGKGFAFVTFLVGEHAAKAMENLDRQIFQGRLLHVLPARKAAAQEDEGAGEGGDAEGGASSSFKKSKEEKRRSNAAKGHDPGAASSRDWSSLFVRSDTAVAAAAAQLGVSKGAILNQDDGNMAVRTALAETQAISATKKHLEDNGVNLAAFNKPRAGCKRSRSVILVKNLPFEAGLDEVRGLFENRGVTLGRVVMPPNRALAVVEAIHPQEAKAAFRKLAFKKFRHVPLYLEWAPDNIFETPPPPPEENKGGKRQDPKVLEAIRRKETTKAAAGIDAVASSAAAPSASATSTATAAFEVKEGGGNGEDQESSSGRTSVYVKNVSFDTTEKKLKQAFRKASGLRAVTIAKKKNLKYDPEAVGGDQSKTHLSMGYGFLEFENAKAAKEAIAKFQDTRVDGHTLLLKLSTRSSSSSSSANKKRKSRPDSSTLSKSKIMVRNVAFQATRNELRDLFRAYGQLKKVRLPRKFDGSHRGFCFVEFLTEQEAQAAMTALKDTHLYGRHLVLEWAKKDESLEQLREKQRKLYNKHDDS